MPQQYTEIRIFSFPCSSAFLEEELHSHAYHAKQRAAVS